MSARAWATACRPATLGVSVAPVAVGAACAAAAGRFRPGAAMAALLGALSLQIGANLANDVLDHEKGADTAERLGPPRAVQSGLLAPSAVWRAAALAFALATVAGVYLTWVAGPAVVIIGLASIAAALAYTGGPYPLGYHGLGDVTVLLFFGYVAVCGTAFVVGGHVPTAAFWAAAPVGALATAVLVVNNLRDRESDRRAGKRTLAVRLGRRGTLVEYGALLAVAFLVPAAAAAAGAFPPWALVTLAAVPLGARLFFRVARSEGRSLNPLLGATARLLVVHGGLLAVALALGAHLR